MSASEGTRESASGHRLRLPPPGVSGAFLLLVLLWGSIFAAVKVGIEAVPPFVFALDRAIAVSALLTTASLVLRRPWPRDSRVIAAAIGMGIATAVNWSIVFWAQQYVPSGLTSVFGASAPIWTAFLAHFLIRGDRLSTTKVLGLLLGLGGVVLLVGVPDLGGQPETLIGSGLLAVAPVTAAIVTIIQARALRTGSPLPLVAIGMWTTSIVLLPFGLAQGGEPARWSSEAFFAFAYLVVFSSCVGLVLSLWLVRRLRPTTMMLIHVIIPAEAVVIGALAFGETVTSRMLAGAILIVAAVGLNALAGGGLSPKPPVAASPAD